MHERHTGPAQLTLTELIAGLKDPAAWPNSVSEVEVRQTHISVVFLAGDCVYKVKKAVDYGFLDFATLEKRRHYCDEEVRLNRRLAPDVYLGVVPITRSGEQLSFEGDGDTVEWAVKMRRLPDEATLQYRLRHGDVDVDVMRNLGRRIADFHAKADSGPSVAEFGRFDVVAGNARENFRQSKDQIWKTVSESVFERLEKLTEEALAQHRQLISLRAECGVPRDTHGDLRLDHVYLLPDREPPGEIVVVDCIEFSERFRFADPIADVAFLVMGLNLRGRKELGREFLESYLAASGDEEGAELVSFYTAYRATVRGKVEGMKLSRDEMTDADRERAMSKSRGSWLLALGELETPIDRPCLLLIAGLPGTGKSRLAESLADQANLQVIRSDVVRKELAGVAEVQHDAAEFGEGIYTNEWNRRTYAECLRRAEELLFEGGRVIVDANFRSETDRHTFLNAATQLGVRSGMLLCEANSEVVRKRLQQRRGDASDADWSTYERAATTWEEPGPQTQAATKTVDTDGTAEDVTAQALKVLTEMHVT
ncbi:polynucleotide kinase [Fuerstiella marisgermanici]|uniref:Polynucleotide kinase n=1 Tax=Fuerstiella marisgermanici TaxID=1891926 RepID=A0A1P8WCF6_9PLAN|nr:polynucleotide kinase [Fuerstiella marisgermanici]